MWTHTNVSEKHTVSIFRAEAQKNIIIKRCTYVYQTHVGKPSLWRNSCSRLPKECSCHSSKLWNNKGEIPETTAKFLYVIVAYTLTISEIKELLQSVEKQDNYGVSKILYSDGGEYEDNSLLGYSAVSSRWSRTTFQRCLLKPSSSW
jgi:hypothetical protein